jgi:hypothetical protein
MSGWSGDPTEPVPGRGYGGYDQAGEPTRMLPPDRRPGGPQGPTDDQGRRRRLWLMAAGILAIIIIVVLLVLLITSSGSNNSSNTVSIKSFNVPTTVPCSGPTTIGVSWSTSNATQVILSIDGSAPFKTYSGGNGADTVPFSCNGQPHQYILTAKASNGAQATQTQTVTQISTSTTQRTTPPTQPPPTTSPPPPTTSATTTPIT